MIEKHVVVDRETGNPKELRYYEDGTLVARLEVVLDSEGNFVSLRELPVEDVVPSSWLDRLLKRKPKIPPIQIHTIDFIGIINWINTIKTIKTIKTIEKVETIGKINEIGKVASGAVVSELISNPRFETGDLSGWVTLSGSPTVDLTTDWYGLPCLKLPPNSTVWHFINQGCYGCEVYLYGAIKSDSAAGYIYVYLVFSDLSYERFMWKVTSVGTWHYFNSQGSVAKPVIRIEVVNPSSNYTVWFASFVALKAVQTVRQIGREDLITRSWDLTSGTTTLLDAVADKRHKIYGWDYEVDADGETGFIATIGGATVKFGRRKTKGVHALTLMHPIICDVNTALSFQSAGNTSLSLRYVTE